MERAATPEGRSDSPCPQAGNWAACPGKTNEPNRPETRLTYKECRPNESTGVHGRGYGIQGGMRVFYASGRLPVFIQRRSFALAEDCVG